jgi:hypothetical protein
MLPLLGLVFTEGFLYFGGFSFISGLLAYRFGLTAFPIGLILAGTGLTSMTTARALVPLVHRPHASGAGGIIRLLRVCCFPTGSRSSDAA